jgi:hypothetical protein
MVDMRAHHPDGFMTGMQDMPRLVMQMLVCSQCITGNSRQDHEDRGSGTLVYHTYLMRVPN